MKVIYTVWANSDGVEGRGVNQIRYICSNEITATELAKGLGPMGMSNGEVKTDWLIDTADEIKQKQKEELKQRALKKLTEEEKKALGLI